MAEVDETVLDTDVVTDANGTSGIGTAEIGTAEIGTAGISGSELGAQEIGAEEFGLEETGAEETGTDEIDPDGVGATDGGDQDGAHDGAIGVNGSSRRSVSHEDLVAEGDAAGDYLERFLDILDFDGDIDLDVEGERAVVSIIGEGDITRLVGDRGEVLDALQELARLAATAETGQRSRLMLDIAGYRARRRTELTELGVNTARKVLDGGEAVRLPAMNPFERKIVHDAVATVDGVESSSEGEEPRRRVVVALAS